MWSSIFEIENHSNLRPNDNPEVGLRNDCQMLLDNCQQLDKKSVNVSLLEKEPMLVQQMDESFCHVESMKQWAKKSTGISYGGLQQQTGGSSGKEGKGRVEKLL